MTFSTIQRFRSKSQHLAHFRDFWMGNNIPNSLEAEDSLDEESERIFHWELETKEHSSSPVPLLSQRLPSSIPPCYSIAGNVIYSFGVPLLVTKSSLQSAVICQSKRHRSHRPWYLSLYKRQIESRMTKNTNRHIWPTSLILSFAAIWHPRLSAPIITVQDL